MENWRRGVLAALCAFTASSGVSGQEPSGPVLSFLNSLADDNREEAASLADEPVSQVQGYGGLVNGGPQAGPWNRRIIDDKDTISVNDAFRSFEPCTFHKAGLVSPDPGERSAWVYYRCPDAVAVIFYVSPSESLGKVQMYKLGKYLITANGLLGWEGATSE